MVSLEGEFPIGSGWMADPAMLMSVSALEEADDSMKKAAPPPGAMLLVTLHAMSVHDPSDPWMTKAPPVPHDILAELPATMQLVNVADPLITATPPWLPALLPVKLHLVNVPTVLSSIHATPPLPFSSSRALLSVNVQSVNTTDVANSPWLG